MKINPLISEIVRGLWLMDVHRLDAYGPFVFGLLSGKQSVAPVNTETKAEVQYYSQDGRVTSSRDDSPGKIAVVQMIGPVMKYGDWCSYGATELAAMLAEANNDKTVKGTILYMDGPGGSVSALNPFLDFAAQKKKPVVVLADDACSLHYWTACSVADHIIGENTISGSFGSVGVVSSFLDVKGYYEKLGYKLHEIYPDESKHKNESFRLALEGKYDQIKTEQLSPIARKFQNAVKEARPNLKEETGVLTGKTFFTDKALELGMIDSIGNMSTAIEMVNVLAEVYDFKNK